jgi:PAS domain-containing protein
MRLRRICAWCGAALDSLSASLAADTPVTHGICPSCLAGFRLERAYSLEDFLERLEGPVVLVDADGVFLAANSRAQAALGKERPQWLGRRGGEVIGTRSCPEAAVLPRTAVPAASSAARSPPPWQREGP